LARLASKAKTMKLFHKQRSKGKCLCSGPVDTASGLIQ
jgi:hypothetical protein